ncbi:MAG: deoxyribodipyrimidine photo-lyase [Candidatus Heimdallarchaeota archaeon]|nr:deoxyribodipyrimidine photo-lyase [Candidatus Heimdallarchaeota archaeon]
MIQYERVQQLNNNKSINNKGSFVIYWMQSSHRTEYNHALEYSIEQANKLQKPLIVYFGLTESFPEANERHYYFLLEGLQEVKTNLEKRGISFILQKISPELGIEKLADEASLIVVDRGYLTIEKKWRRYLSGKIECPLIQIESNVIVPVEEASDKEEYGAYTIRSKITKKLEKYLVSLDKRVLKIKSDDYRFDTINPFSEKEIISDLKIDHSIKRIKHFRGGISKARNLLQEFIKTKLDKYELMRNDPTEDYQSNLSPYLHLGQISPLEVALEVLKIDGQTIKDFLEQLIIRRELSINFVFYNNGYDKYDSLNLPNWASETLEVHTKDKREYLYSLKEFEQGLTHDPYWNAAQKEMTLTGKMHNYMRMYWGKKILEWTKTPKQAHEIALYLNNKYELDGRDPNGFTGVAWCFGKHDRPWMERPIFGKVRYMNANGLKRKFNAERYVEKITMIEKKL